MKKINVLCFLVLLGNLLYAQQQNEITTSALQIGEKLQFTSEILNEDRSLNIYLPNGYAKDSLQTYPVIYLLDGSMDEDFIHVAGIVQFTSFSWINIIPESIVVGIANVDRKRDFTYPTTIEKDKEDFPTTGKSKDFMHFLEKEVQPLINKKYKTNSVKTLIGQSLGGLLATEILFKKPHLFDNYIIVSPSLWWDNQSLLNITPQTYNTKKSIYVAVGKEGDIMENDAKNLFLKLHEKQQENTTLHYEFFKKKTHGDVLHLAVYHAFEAIFKKKEQE